MSGPKTGPLAQVAARIAALPPGRRLVAVAGPPAVGKSTQADALAEAVTAGGRGAQVVPMDGFHMDNATLDALGLRSRKGAPETFDKAGLLSLAEAARAGGALPYPTFDRARDQVVPDGGVLEAEIAIFEGNYLLLDAPGWRDLAPLWDMTVLLAAPEEVLRARLTKRWLDLGLSEAEALAKAEGNDLPNARRVLSGSVAADWRIDSI